ncbi:MAG TPA: hypothetical protein VG144_08225, partial [Gaiellaceae bacterium]|nr:hypothetical protein [Gaiellaceae bacterium]
MAPFLRPGRTTVRVARTALRAARERQAGGRRSHSLITNGPASVAVLLELPESPAAIGALPAGAPALAVDGAEPLPTDEPGPLDVPPPPAPGAPGSAGAVPGGEGGGGAGG